MSLSVELERVSFGVRNRRILSDINLTVEAGEFAFIIGASGAGKSTLLSVVCGLERLTAGVIKIGGREVRGLNPRVQLVFQDGAVFPWMSVRQNVEFGLKAAGVTLQSRRLEAERAIRLVGLERVPDAYVHQLSFGMRQRVALARALAVSPQVLLMDEPFAALDAITQGELEGELVRLWQQTGVTVLFVTHNLREALTMADSIHLLGAEPARLQASWRVTIPRGEREHHPALRPLELEIRERLQSVRPDRVAAIA